MGVADRQVDEIIFLDRVEELNEELEVLNAEAIELQEVISKNINDLLNISALI